MGSKKYIILKKKNGIRYLGLEIVIDSMYLNYWFGENSKHSKNTKTKKENGYKMGKIKMFSYHSGDESILNGENLKM